MYFRFIFNQVVSDLDDGIERDNYELNESMKIYQKNTDDLNGNNDKNISPLENESKINEL